MTKMTAYHDSQSIEARKARYSRELAAYTLRQWDLARQTMESSDSTAQNGTAARPSTTSSRDRSRSGSVPPDSERAARIRQGMLFDYLCCRCVCRRS